ncbi:carbohydrate ABC transporter permease [Oceanispirochaeta sp.]|jgi:raffinose/stachyose/melibiose transport system permease protein|uniref:carbohydrate ABC transporter permease n=1 Tax=Oceanispirochaeta sp. TaxID=2035350 RepID=UPI0026357B65|nr:carbohydrate ABC transporter permease [Oceanispirochaeta sp.]MDA3956577.1 carbohydrate ABC transporter permease [Oceanispirochaeta sp.]
MVQNHSHRNVIADTLDSIGKAGAYVIMTLFSLMTIYPIFWLILNSFKTTVEFRSNMVGLPKVWTLQNYVGAWKIGEFDQLIGNSFLYTGVATIGIILLSLRAGFAFAKIKSRATKPIYASFIIGILLTIQSLMVPLFLEVTQLDRILGDFFQLLGIMKSNKFHLFYNNRFGVILIYIGSALPTAIYLSTEYLKSIPASLIEASRMDGAKYEQIFHSIILPMAKPIITIVSILNIPKIWNEFALINILVSKTELQSLPLGIFRFSGSLSSDYGKQFAALVIGFVPMFSFYLLFRKQITQSVAAGAIKE